MSCLLISGYRQHGKDYFYNSLINGNINEEYDIYLNENSYISCLAILNFSKKRYVRIAFADILKEYLAGVFGMDVNELNGMKSIQISAEHRSKYLGELPNKSTYRDAMIHLGLYMRNKGGEDFWVNAAVDSIKIGDTEIPIVTDFRFPSEIKYGELTRRRVITLRVHRNDVEIPPLNDISEHSLDNYPFDLIAIPRGEKLHRIDNGCIYYKIY